MGNPESIVVFDQISLLLEITESSNIWVARISINSAGVSGSVSWVSDRRITIAVAWDVGTTITVAVVLGGCHGADGKDDQKLEHGEGFVE